MEEYEKIHEKALIAEGEVKGQLKALSSLVADGTITLEKAAEEFGTSVTEFISAAKEAGFELPKES